MTEDEDFVDPKVLVIGAKGNMGRRYMSVLGDLEIGRVGIDVGDNWREVITPDITHVILATPTHLHLPHSYELLSLFKEKGMEIDVLVEKPLFKIEAPLGVTANLRALDVFKEYEKQGCRLYLVNNYAYYPNLSDEDVGPTVYSYYNSGNDGLAWDCIQLIALARSNISLSNESCDWIVYINGRKLDKSHIDLTYVKMIQDFVFNAWGKLWGHQKAALAHLKVLEYKIAERTGQ